MRINLNASLQDPKTIKSLVSDFADEGLDLSDIPLDDMDAARDMIVDRVMNSYTDVAARGKADYDARRAAQTSPSSPSNPSSPRKGKDYTERWSDVDKYPGIKQTISGHEIYRDKENPDIYVVDGIMFTREEAEDIVSN